MRKVKKGKRYVLYDKVQRKKAFTGTIREIVEFIKTKNQPNSGDVGIRKALFATMTKKKGLTYLNYILKEEKEIKRNDNKRIKKNYNFNPNHK